MKMLVDEVMALEEAERLPAALDLLADVSDEHGPVQVALRRRFRLSPKPAAVLAYLLASGGKSVSFEQIFMVCWGYESETQANVIPVMVCKIRRAVPDLDIENIWGFGYSVPKAQAAAILQSLERPEGEEPPPRGIYDRSARNSGAPWSRADELLAEVWIKRGHSFGSLCRGIGRSEAEVTRHMTELGAL